MAYNSISKIQFKGIDTFGNNDFSKDNSHYWLPVEPKVKEDEFAKTVGSVIMPPSEARKTNNLKIIGYSVAGAVVLTAATIFFLLKGGPKGFSRAIKNARDYFETKLAESALNANKTASKLNIRLSKIFGKAFTHANAVNNFTTFKDLLFKKAMNITKFTAKIHNKITNLFLKIGAKAVKSRYGATAEKLTQTFNLTNSAIIKNSTSLGEIIEINGIKKTKKEWLDYAVSLNSEIATTHTKGFGNDAVKSRFKYMLSEIVPNLVKKFKKVTTLFEKDNLTRFATDNAILEEKTLLKNKVLKNRNILSYNPNNLFSDSNSIILEIAKSLKNQDISELGEIRRLIKEYTKKGASDSAQKQQILELIDKFDITHPKTNIGELKKLISNYKHGKIEELLDIEKAICSKDDYKLIEKSYKSYIKSLDKSIYTETEDFINKLRDLTMGSAPTDVLSMLGSLVVLGYELAKSKDKDQRQSIALKYGFPALSGIGVSLYCNAKLFAGLKALLAGAASTFILNRTGKWLDEKLKSKTSANNDLTQKSVNQES